MDKTYVVAEGKSIKCARGTLNSLEPITALDLVKHASQEEEGRKYLEELVSAGFVVEPTLETPSEPDPPDLPDFE